MNQAPPAAEPSVCVVILHWHNLTDTLACITSLRRQSYRNFRVVIIDNGSDKASSIRLSAATATGDYRRNATNLGYAGGCNVGIRHASGLDADYVWLLNSDATVEPDALRSLVAVGESNPSIGLVAPVVRCAPSAADVNLLCGRFDRHLLRLHYIFTLDAARDLHARQSGEMVLMGAALLARMSMLRTIGGFDERFFAYWEDVDLSLRCADAGFSIVLDEAAVVCHPRKEFFDPAAPVRPDVYYYLARNEILLVRKLGSGRPLLKALLWAFLEQMNMLARSKWNGAGCDAILAGMWDGWHGRSGPWLPGRGMPLLPRALLRWKPLLPRQVISW